MTHIPSTGPGATPAPPLTRRYHMGRAGLLWLLGVPIPIIILLFVLF